MLIATLVNNQGQHSTVEVPGYASRVPPYVLQRGDRLFIIDYSGWEPATQENHCVATFKELGEHRVVNIDHLTLQKQQPQDSLPPAEQEGEEAA